MLGQVFLVNWRRVPNLKRPQTSGGCRRLLLFLILFISRVGLMIGVLFMGSLTLSEGSVDVDKGPPRC